MSSEPKVHPAELNAVATNAANAAGAELSGQPFVTDESGAVVLVSTYAEIEEVPASTCLGPDCGLCDDDDCPNLVPVEAVGEPVALVEPVVEAKPVEKRKSSQKPAKKK